MNLLNQHRAFILLLVLAALLFSSDIRSWREFVRAESYFALGARLMVEQGDWLTPHAPDEQPLNKPPLTYWLIGVCYKLFGAGYGSARLPSVVAALGVLAIVYAIGFRFYGKRVGMLSAALLATSMLFMSFARTAMSDMLLTLFVTASLGAFAIALTSESKHVIFAGYVALALGLLTKGPIAIALVALPIAAELVISKSGAALKKLRIGSGLLVVLAIAAPYFVIVYFRRGAGVLWFFFIGENLQRFTGNIYSDLARPFWYQLAAFFGDFVPWSLLILPAIWVSWKRRQGGQTDRCERILYLWLLSTLLLFSISSFKRDYYLLPAMPAAALIVGRLLSIEIRARFVRRTVQVFLIVCAAVIVLVAVATVKAATVLGVQSVARFVPICVAGLGFVSIAWLLARAKVWATSLALSGVIVATFVGIEFALLPAFTRFQPAVSLVNSTSGRTWITSNKAGGWANDLAFNLPPPHHVERIAVKDDTPRLIEFLTTPNTVALIAESDFLALQQYDTSLRILRRAETFGHGGVTQKLLLRPEREILVVVGH
jgi:4-amino-4-deoxy-L-arabinose transferase-like glycosyltransferase